MYLKIKSPGFSSAKFLDKHCFGHFDFSSGIFED